MVDHQSTHLGNSREKSHTERGSLTRVEGYGDLAIEMPPPPSSGVAEYIGHLRAYARDFAPDATIGIPRMRLMAILDLVADESSLPTTASRCRDHRVKDLVQRLNRKESTIRQMCADGEFSLPTGGPGAYRHRGREWMVTEAAVEAYEERQRQRGRQPADDLSAWRKLKPRRSNAP
jgi:hypothetical protein